MSDTWLQTPTALINMSNIDIIGFDMKVKEEEVNITMFFNARGAEPIPIAKLKSKKAGLKFMNVVSKLIKDNKRLIDAGLIADQCNSDESDV